MSQTEKTDLGGAARKLERIEKDTLLITLGGAFLALVLTRSWASMFGLLLGGLLMLANFHYLWKASRRMIEEETGSKTAMLAKVFFSFFLFLGAVAFVLLVMNLPVVPFFLGTLSLLLAILLRSLVFT